jgi:hypothetical protein
MSRLRTEQMLTGLKARQDARAVLTTAQKTKLDGMRQQLASRTRKAMRDRALGGRGRGAAFRGRGSQPGFGGEMQGPQIRRRVIEGPGGEQRVIEERIIRGPDGPSGGPQGPMMLRREGRPVVPPQPPSAPDSLGK